MVHFGQEPITLGKLTGPKCNLTGTRRQFWHKGSSHLIVLYYLSRSLHFVIRMLLDLAIFIVITRFVSTPPPCSLVEDSIHKIIGQNLYKKVVAMAYLCIYLPISEFDSALHFNHDLSSKPGKLVLARVSNMFISGIADFFPMSIPSRSALFPFKVSHIHGYSLSLLLLLILHPSPDSKLFMRHGKSFFSSTFSKTTISNALFTTPQ